jgi:hyperosmotically inducible periplasmic protein
MNATRLSSLLAMALLVPLIAACGGSPVRESTGEYVDDTIITTKIIAEFVGSGVNLANIRVETFKGNVQLSGFTKTEQEKQATADIAKSVNGVKEVFNEILIK